MTPREPSGLGKQRRRRWPADEKRRIMAETEEAGASVSLVARRHNLNTNMLFAWLRKAGSVVPATSCQSEAFVPAVIVVEPVAESQPPVTPSSAPTPVGRMEIVLKGGDRVIVGADFDAAALARMMKVLDRCRTRA
jgi:transposase